MSDIGYAWIQTALGAPDFLGGKRARLAASSRIERLPDGALLVPHKLAPEPTLLHHALFALKHEGVRLDLLAGALRRLPADDLAAWVQATPNSVYGRKLGHLWERWHRQQLPGLIEVGVASGYAPLFDPEQYFVGPAQRDSRWRIEFNGLGDLDFCPVVRKTPALLARTQKDILGQAKAFADEVGPALLERAMNWAYLSETEGSFAIEGEAPTQGKANLFAALLRRAHEQRRLTEELLVELQNAAISNPFDKAVQFRTEQNRLQRDVPGAAGVTYVPPAPELAMELMSALMRLANQRPAALDALVHAAVVSFAFVFIHPFMDGNGRLSRFLIHHCLGQSGLLPPQFLLPISVAMKKPRGKKGDFDGNILFPSAMMIQLVEAALKGERRYEARLFDGSEGGEKVFETIASIGPRLEGDRNSRLEPALQVSSLEKVPRWPVSMSYFDGGPGDRVPVYTMKSVTFANGVVSDLVFEFPEFSLAAKAVRYEPLPEEACGR